MNWKRKKYLTHNNDLELMKEYAFKVEIKHLKEVKNFSKKKVGRDYLVKIFDKQFGEFVKEKVVSSVETNNLVFIMSNVLVRHYILVFET